MSDAPRRKRWLLTAIVASSLLAMLIASPYAFGLVAARRAGALVAALDAAGGGIVHVRLARYTRGYASAHGLLEIVIDAPTERVRFEAPFTVGHGPIPWSDVFAGRSAMRVCAGFVSFASGRGRGPGGTPLAPLDGRVVLGVFGGVHGELGLRAEDIRPLTPLGRSSSATITLTGEASAPTLVAYLDEHVDRRADAPSRDLGGARATLARSKEHLARRLEIARFLEVEGRLRTTIDQLVVAMREPRSRVRAAPRSVELSAMLVRRQEGGDVRVLRAPSLRWTAAPDGDHTRATFDFSFASLSGPDLALRATRARGDVRYATRAADAVRRALATTLRAPQRRTGPPRSGGGAAPAPTESPSIVDALASTRSDPRFGGLVRAVLSLLRTAPSAALELDVKGEDGAPLLTGRFALRVDPGGIDEDDVLAFAALRSLVVDARVGLARDLARSVAQREVERRAADLPTADDVERRRALVDDVLEGAIASGAIEVRDGLVHARAVVPMATPGRATLEGRTLDAYAGTPLGIALRRAEMPRVRIALGTVVSTGDVTDGSVIVALAPRARDLRLCAEAELLDASPTLEGDVHVQLEVAPTGTVSSARVLANTLGDESLASCLLGVVTALPLPATRRGGASVVPIHITRGGPVSLDAFRDPASATPETPPP